MTTFNKSKSTCTRYNYGIKKHQFCSKPRHSDYIRSGRIFIPKNANGNPLALKLAVEKLSLFMMAIINANHEAILPKLVLN